LRMNASDAGSGNLDYSTILCLSLHLFVHSSLWRHSKNSLQSVIHNYATRAGRRARSFQRHARERTEVANEFR
jgi:hypothetical protein